MSGRERRSRRATPAAPTSWERVADWYDGWVGDRGSRYHRALAIPVALELLQPAEGEEILDVGAGQGALAPYIAQRGGRYTGVDASPRLIAAARRRHGAIGRFVVGDARRLRDVGAIGGARYHAAVFLLSIQDMDPLEQVLASVASALRSDARIVVVMTHPAFRQPRHSGWGFDESRGLVFRRVDAYLTPMAVPLKPVASEPPTRSFHRPISGYVNALGAVGFAIDSMREIPDLPPEAQPGKRGRALRRAHAEIPMFLAFRAVRG